MVRQISIRCCANYINYAFFLSGQCLIVLIDPHFDFKSVWRFPRFKSKAWLIHLGVSENMVPLIPKDYHVSYFFHIKITVWGYSKFKHTDFGVHSQKVITGKGIGSRQITETNQRSTLCLSPNFPLPWQIRTDKNQLVKPKKSAQKPRFSIFIWGYKPYYPLYILYYQLQIRMLGPLVSGFGPIPKWSHEMPWLLLAICSGVDASACDSIDGSEMASQSTEDELFIAIFT